MSGRVNGRVIVVGAGVAGLSAGYELANAGVPVTVLEAAPDVGGKLRTEPVADVAVESGAESLLLRGGEVTALLGRLGLADQLVHPAAVGAALSRRGRLRPLPPRTFFGIPTDLRALAGSRALSAAAVARAALEPFLPGGPPAGDVAVGGYVAARLGRGVAAGLVDPLLGGVYAGRADLLSLQATMPALAAALAGRRSLVRAAAALLPPRAPAAAPGDAPRPTPVFGALRDGMSVLPQALARAIADLGGEVRTGAPARELAQLPDGGWRVGGQAGAALDAAGVVLALPAAPAARLLREVAPAAAAELTAIEYAGVALVTLAFDGGPPLPPLSGYLVPAGERRPVKAVTAMTVKWPSLAARAGGLTVLRCSFGRYGEAATLQRDDVALVADARAELAARFGLGGAPVATRVTRWGGALPQYAVGHLDRVARVRAAVPAGLALAGAAYDGVGVPACLASGRRAAAAVTPAAGGAE